MKRLSTSLLAVAIVSAALAQSVVNVSIGGGGSKTVKGTIKGQNYIDYRVNVGAGQTLSTTLTTKSTAAYFNITPPGTEWAIHNGSINGNKASRRIPMSGKYTVRVYMIAAAGRRNESASFSLKLSVAGKALKPLSTSQDAVLPGTKFHASSELSVKSGDATQLCKANVLRYSGGSATVEVHLPQSQKLQLLFVGGSLVGWTSTERPKASRQGDSTSITVDGASFLVPDALVYGG